MNLAIILIYRPDCDDNKSPFSGIEIFAIEETRNPDDTFDDIIKPAQEQFPNAHFHIDIQTI